MRGDSGDAEPTAVVVGGEELTERQQEMLAVFDDYVAAWQADDAEAVTSFFGSTGSATFLGERITVAELGDYVRDGSFRSLDIHEPLLVLENGLVSFHTIAGSGYADVIEFTPTGEVLIMSHTITR